jgi:hypothetical protein
MSGVEMFDMIGWLKSHGHSEIEDQIIRVRLQGDKKFQLCSCARRPSPQRTCSIAAPPIPALGASDAPASVSVQKLFP